jgi:hypothetical protein
MNNLSPKDRSVRIAQYTHSQESFFTQTALHLNTLLQVYYTRHNYFQYQHTMVTLRYYEMIALQFFKFASRTITLVLPLPQCPALFTSHDGNDIRVKGNFETPRYSFNVAYQLKCNFIYITVNRNNIRETTTHLT